MARDVAADRRSTLGATMASLPAETRKASPTASRTVKNTVLRIVALLGCKPRSAPIVVPNSDFRANEMQPRGGPALAFSRRGSVGPIGTEIERLRASEDLNGATAAALREALAESPGFSAEMHDEAGASTM
jgi:hypothetical protein